MSQVNGKISYYDLFQLVRQLLDMGYSRSAVYSEVISTERVMAKTLAKMLAGMPTRYEKKKLLFPTYFLWGNIALSLLLLSTMTLWVIYRFHHLGIAYFLAVMQGLLIMSAHSLTLFSKRILSLVAGEAFISLLLSFVLWSVNGTHFWGMVLTALVLMRMVLVGWISPGIGTPFRTKKVPYRNADGDLRLRLEFEFVRNK